MVKCKDTLKKNHPRLFEVIKVTESKFNDFDSSMTRRRSYYESMGLGKASSYTGTYKQNTAMLNWMKQNGFAKGGQIGSLIKQAGEDGFVLARTGEEILSIPKLKIASDMIDKLMNVSNVDLNARKITNNETSQNSNVNMNITLPNVKDYETFKKQLLKSKEFESAAQNVTINKAFGKSSLRKSIK